VQIIHRIVSYHIVASKVSKVGFALHALRWMDEHCARCDGQTNKLLLLLLLLQTWECFDSLKMRKTRSTRMKTNEPPFLAASQLASACWMIRLMKNGRIARMSNMFIMPRQNCKQAINQSTRMALGERKPPPTLRRFFPLLSPGGSTICAKGLPYLATVKNPSILFWIQMLIRITAQI